MKKPLLLLLLASLSVATHAREATCKIYDFGQVGEAPAASEETRAEDVAMGHVKHVSDEIHFTQRSVTIQASVGTMFGVKHMFSGLDKDEKILAVVIHPPMTNQAGEEVTKSSWHIKPSSQFSGYSFDTPEELKTGFWAFEFYHGETLLCKKGFNVQ